MITDQTFTGTVEFPRPLTLRPNIAHVIFDFDGTLSLIRQGWPEVMVPMLAEYLPAAPGDTPESVSKLLYDDIMRLNGKQTIYQMIQFADRIKERGGTPKEPLWYKHEYLRRLDERIESRKADLKAGSSAEDEWLLFGGRALLENLKARGLKLHLLSGTDQQYVREEAELLDVAKYFEGEIYGALDDYKSFSKKMAMERIIADHNIAGEQLLSFGDGYVEIENTKELGGIAVAVASDEANNGTGNIDTWKRNRLLQVDADIVIPDYRDADPLLRHILGN